MNLRIFNFGLLRPSFDAQAIAKYKKWFKYTAIATSSSGLLVISGLWYHKQKNSVPSALDYERRHETAFRVDYGQGLSSWLERVVSDSYSAVLLAQKYSSGIELPVIVVADLTAVDSSDLDVSSYVERVVRRIKEAVPLYTILEDMDLQQLRLSSTICKSVPEAADHVRSVLMKRLIHRANELGALQPHLTRVPRDVDGKLIPNKDAGCSPGNCLNNGNASNIEIEARNTSVAELRDNGFVILRSIVPQSIVRSVRNNLNIKSSFSKNANSEFETRVVVPEEIFVGSKSDGVAYTQLAAGRYAYQLRCSELESVVKEAHANVMPIVWTYLATVGRGNSVGTDTPDTNRNPSLPSMLLSNQKITSTPPRVFVSSVSLVTSDPLAGEDSWHAVNGGGGLSVIIPLTPIEKDTGCVSCLPGSHRSWKWSARDGLPLALHTMLLEGGPVDVAMSCGDALLMDNRTMRKTNRNMHYNKATVWLVFQYDYSDRVSPYQWLPTTLTQNAIASVMVRLNKVYKQL